MKRVKIFSQILIFTEGDIVEHLSPSPSSSLYHAVEDDVTANIEGGEASARRDADNIDAAPTWSDDEEAEAVTTVDTGLKREDPSIKLLEHASYLFDKDRAEQLRRTINLLPRGREFVVFNVFGDLARAFGYGRRRRKRVDFPEDVLEQYEQKGDVAGKDRFVPSAKQPYKGLSATTKKRKLSAVYSSWTVKASEFVPRVERIDDYTQGEYFCERNCIACECCCDCCASTKKPGLTIVMEGYFSDLNLASFFLHSHATRTFESAMGVLEYVQLHTFSLTTMAPKTWNQGYSKQHMGMLTGSIWIFGYCIRTIVDMSGSSSDCSNKLPSEVGFRKVMESFAALCLSISEGIKIVLQYSHNFYNFGKECIRILKILEILVGFKAEFNLKKPLRRGDGLKLKQDLKKKAVEKQRAVTVTVAKTKSIFENDDEPLEWKSFEEISGNEKVYCLRQLINASSDGIGLVQTQLRFLLDDIVDSVKDIAEADLLFLLADMYDRVKFLLNVGKKITKTEFEQIASLMTDFCKDFQSFLDYGQHIIKRFVEFNDIVHLTHDYLVDGLNLEILAEMLPANIFKKKKRAPYCCGGQNHGIKTKKAVVDKYFPKYKVMDFLKVYYREAVHGQIYANKYQFCLGWSIDYMGDVVPQSFQCRWGEMDTMSPKTSFDEYVDPDEFEEETNVEIIRPILIGSGNASSEDHVEVPTQNEGVAETGAAGDQTRNPNTDSNPNTNLNP